MSSKRRDWINKHHPRAQWRGDEALVHCPFHPDEHASCSINIVKGVYFCHACGATGPLSEMAKHMGVDYIDDENTYETCEYVYRKADGTIAYTLKKTVDSFGDKKFYRDPSGFKEPILYRLPEVLEAIRKGIPIIWVEGEKDVESLRKHGFIATTTPNGANSTKTLPDAVKLLPPNAKIILCGDADGPGQRYIQAVGKALLEYGITPLIITPADLGFTITKKHGKDISDWLENNPYIQSLIDNAQPFSIDSDKQTDKKTNTDLNLDEQGMAEMMADLYHDQMKYVHAHKKWYIYENGYWKWDQTKKVDSYIKELQKELHKIASETSQENERKEIEDFIHSLRSQYKQRNILELLKREQKVSIHPTDFDTNKFLFNVSNGTINLQSGILQEHNPFDLITRSSSKAYNPSAKCDRWLSFLNEIFLEDQETIDFMQRYLGYILSGDTSEHIFPVFHGNGANGKSVLINTIQSIMSDYSSMTPASTLMANKSNGNTNDIARLKGVRFVAAQESGNGSRLDEEKIKTMTGGDKISARFLYGEYFDFFPEFKIVLITNHKPRIKGADNGIWRRVLLIPFNYTVPPENQDKHLEQKLKEESEGILAWMVEGYRLWQQDGLLVPESIRSSTDEYRDEEDSIASFLDEYVMDNPSNDIQASVLYDKFRIWCKETGEYQLDIREFSKRMETKGYEKKRKGTGKFWLNLSFKRM